MVKKGILVVSFGTTYKESEIRSIKAMERAAESAFPAHRIYRAWTSKIIRKILFEREGYEVDDVSRALARMRDDGISEVVVLSTHILSGIEYEMMQEAVEARRKDFSSLFVTSSLLSCRQDYERVAAFVEEELFADITASFKIDLKEDDTAALVLMGHGTTHPSHIAYEILQENMRKKGRNNVWVAVMEGEPSFEDILPNLEKNGYKKLVLAPFMMVAGDHAYNDMAGKEDSWACLAKEKGFETLCRLKGLGEFDGIRKLFLSRIPEENIIG